MGAENRDADLGEVFFLPSCCFLSAKEVGRVKIRISLFLAAFGFKHAANMFLTSQIGNASPTPIKFIHLSFPSPPPFLLVSPFSLLINFLESRQRHVGPDMLTTA
jgi:hypothetical protein